MAAFRLSRGAKAKGLEWRRRQRPRLLLYTIVISKGRRNDVARFLNAQRLREDWPELRLLVSSRMRRACERKLGLPRNKLP